MITSAQNPKIQAVRELLSRPRARREAGAFVIEGVRLAEEARASGWPLQQGFYGENISPRGAGLVQRLIEKENLQGLVDIVGAFCMDTCSKGVSIRVGDSAYSGIRPEDAEAFFYKEIMGKVNTKLLKR